MIGILQTALILGLMYGLVSLALFVSFRILNIADLTTDGSFVFGMAVSCVCAKAGHPYLGILLGMVAGGLAGYCTAYLHTKGGIPAILAGIITATGLYTINLATLGFRANLALLKEDTVFTLSRKRFFGNSFLADVLPLLVVVGLVMVGLYFFLETRLGLSIRATGDNPSMVKASSIDPRITITVGLVLANALTGLSGAFVGQFQKTADINSGIGIVVVGLASLVIGETLLKEKTMSANITACFVGNIVYRMLYALILKSHMIPVECLKLLTAMIVAIAIASPNIKAQRELKKRMKREGVRHA